jgi:hypothetical protein
MNDTHDLVYRLRKRAEIRRQISTRKSVQEGQPDRIADLLEEAADYIENLPVPASDCYDVGNVHKGERSKDSSTQTWVVIDGVLKEKDNV